MIANTTTTTTTIIVDLLPFRFLLSLLVFFHLLELSVTRRKQRGIKVIKMCQKYSAVYCDIIKKVLWENQN